LFEDTDKNYRTVKRKKLFATPEIQTIKTVLYCSLNKEMIDTIQLLFDENLMPDIQAIMMRLQPFVVKFNLKVGVYIPRDDFDI